jgi:hypothetical protein
MGLFGHVKLEVKKDRVEIKAIEAEAEVNQSEARRMEAREKVSSRP